MTTVCAVLFMLGALVLAILGQRGPRSLVSGIAGPAGDDDPGAAASGAWIRACNW